MGLFQNAREKYQKKAQENDKVCVELISRIDEALSDAKAIFADTKSFIDPGAEEKWKIRNKAILADYNKLKTLSLVVSTKYTKLVAKQIELSDTAYNLKQKIHEHNEHVITLRIEDAYSLIGEVEGKKLDRQQMACIIKEARNNLVIAGAGTGKTTTIVGKVKYLLKAEKCLPQDILVLSFTNASASEMKARIVKETDCSIEVSTFHKFGINIITKVNGLVPRITKLNLRDFIREQLKLNIQSDSYFSLLCWYLLYNHVIAKSEFEFQSEEEYEEYLRFNPPTTINNEVVKSYGEMDIANFLTQHSIRYVYECPYEIDTRTSEHGQYHPDFYLPDYKIYIEYFGINRKGEVPPYFSPRDGMSATEAYLASMKWKRALHKEHQTTMIECYGYEKLEGTLLESLKDRLEKNGVVLMPKSSQQLWDEVIHGNNVLLEGLVELFETLINLIKNNNYDIATVRKLNHGGSNVKSNDVLLSLLEPIFAAYSNYLSENNEIDFSDMINLASEYIKQGKYVNPYKYVIVDEYQDISKSRFALLKDLRESGDYKLFCVGDDWQSIYRFAGSDVGLITNFSKYWGPTEISKIETTYRFCQQLIDISSEFIMRNPVQIKKAIRGKKEDYGFPVGEISGYTNKYAIEFMAKKLKDLPTGSRVFFIGRYSYDAKSLTDSGLFTCQYNIVNGLVDVKSRTRPDLKMSFLTAHKAKGLQADYVFIINNKKSRMGFPSKIQDAPVLDLLYDDHDRFPYAEERRLFYVALTRARKKVYLVTIKDKESEFVKELEQKYGEDIRKERFECPLCGGTIVKKSGPYGEFYGCSNYRTNGCTYKRKIL